MADIERLDEEWQGHSGEEVRKFLQSQLAKCANPVKSLTVNSSENKDYPDGNGNVDIVVPTTPVSDDMSDETSTDAAQAGAVAAELNAIKSNLPVSASLGNTSGNMVELNFYNEGGDNLNNLSLMIPAAQEIGEVIQPVVTTALVSSNKVKLGDNIIFDWGYDCFRYLDGDSERANFPASLVTITVKLGNTVIEEYSQTLTNVSPSADLRRVTISGDKITSAGSVTITVASTTPIDEVNKTSRSTKTVTVVLMDLSTTYDPSERLALSNGYTDGDTIQIPYTYNVPSGTTLYIYKDGVFDSSTPIAGYGRNYVTMQASSLASGRHNVQLIAANGTLLSEAVSIDFRKAGNNVAYLGMRQSFPVSNISAMPLDVSYGGVGLTTPTLNVSQFGSISINYAAWNSASLQTIIRIQVGGVTTQTLSVGRTMQTLTQRFERSGNQTLAISVMDGDTTVATRSYNVVVTAAEGVTETVASGIVTELSASNRSNSEADPANWGGITQFEGVNWISNGWITRKEENNENVTALLLTNGATAEIDIKPFINDPTDNYSIAGGGMTLEMEIELSNVIERGASVVECLYDNNNDGYPMGIKITTEKAGIYYGGVDEIKTSEKVTDSEGNYISFSLYTVSAGTDISSLGLYVKPSNNTWVKTTDTTARSGVDYYQAVIQENSDNAQDLYISRAMGVDGNIALNQWMHITFVVTKANDSNTSIQRLGLLYINGVLSRAARYTSGGSTFIQTVPQKLLFNSDKCDIRLRSVRYYRTALTADEVVGNWIVDRPNLEKMVAAHDDNAVGGVGGNVDTDNNLIIDHNTLRQRGRGCLIFVRSADTDAQGNPGHGLDELWRCTNKKTDFLTDKVIWEPPIVNNQSVGEGFVAENVNIRIQGTSSVKYPYKNIRIYLLKGAENRKLYIGGADASSSKGYPLRGSANSMEQAVLCAKTDFVDSSLAGNTGGAHLFDYVTRNTTNNNNVHILLTPPQEYDARVRQSVDGIPCDVYSSLDGQNLHYCGQFVLNNEKSKSERIFGMEGVKDNGVDVVWDCAFALEALTNSSPMTLFHPAGSADSQALATQLADKFDEGFEFNYPEDAVWAKIDEGQWDDNANKWKVKPVPGARAAIKRWMGWIYDCVPSAMRSNPDYGDQNGWSGKSNWVSQKFKDEISQYFNLDHLLTYYIFIDYLAGKDQLAKNIIWRTWDGYKWFAGFYDGDTWEAIRNDAFISYLYNITRDSYDYERSKYAFEGHSSWLWCLVLANFEDELKARAAAMRSSLFDNTRMLDEFIGTMIGNWSARQYNKSGKLKYIDTIDTMNYVYTLTGSRKEHITQFLTDRAHLLDGRYVAGGYMGDTIQLTVVRNSSDPASSLTLKSGDLYYFGYAQNMIWQQAPQKVEAGDTLTLTFSNTYATNDPLQIIGASCITELDMTNMGTQLNGNVSLNYCTMLTKLIMPATVGVAQGATLQLNQISKLQYIDITDQSNATTTEYQKVFDVRKHTRLTTFLAGGTALTKITLAEGCPITRAVFPATIQSLELRYLPNLALAPTTGTVTTGLTLEGLNGEGKQLNIKSLNFAGCPHIDWRELFDMCPNIERIRIEGISGRIRSSELEVFKQKYEHNQLHGMTADGVAQIYPALIGKVQLINIVPDWESSTLKEFCDKCGLEVEQSPYSHYIFDDMVTDPANISNEDNLTGYDYMEEGETYDDGTHPNGYYHSGHIDIIHDRCQPCAGRINPTTHKMHVTKLSKTNYSKLADGVTDIDLTDSEAEGYDFFIYIPKYYYKGVNDYKTARKHFFLSSNSSAPASTAKNTTKQTLSVDMRVAEGKGIRDEDFAVGDTLDSEEFYTNININVYRIDVSGDYKQVRFPTYHSNVYVNVFADKDNKVISKYKFYMETDTASPRDFDNAIGDYIFLTIPDSAKWLYFQCTADAFNSNPQIILTDSADIEAIEPDWVEHKAELIGIYQGTCYAVDGNDNRTYQGGIVKEGLRSISGVTVFRGNGTSTTSSEWNYDANGDPINLPNSNSPLPTNSINGTAQDIMNLARVRNLGVVGGEYSTVSYETSKDMANLLMVWFGTRDVETIVGRGNSTGETTGVRNSIAFADSAYYAQNQYNKMWGIECWTGSTYEWVDKGCFNAASFASFKANKRVEKSGDVSDNFYKILQQDRQERKVKAVNNQPSNPCAVRVRFGRYCDIVVSAFTDDSTYLKGYACYQSINGSKARVLGRSNNSASASAGVAYSHATNASSVSSTFYGGRLCFFGILENESDLTQAET